MSPGPAVIEEAARKGLEAWLAETFQADRVGIARLERLGGGAIQENLLLDVAVEGGPQGGRCELVLRTDAPSGVAESRPRSEEYAIIRAAHSAGVPVPEPLGLEPAGQVLGKPFYVMRKVTGEARGIRLVRDPLVAERAGEIAGDLARALASLHHLRPPLPSLAFIEVPSGPLLHRRLDDLRRGFDALAEPQPVFEWGLRWLERHGPKSYHPVLIHADLRTGNYLVHEGHVTAILDWEFARLSDPLEDLGWLLARCWRVGRYDRHCGGIASRAALLDAYDEASDSPVDRAAVRAWELFATIRWGMIALQQAQRHFSGAESSLELGLTAHVVPVLERDVLAYVEAIEEGRDL